MITRIEAYGYRCFPELSIDLDRFHVLAGANGAGKTTLLDIPALLGDLTDRGSLSEAFLGRRWQRSGRTGRAGTLLELLHKGQGTQIAFAIEARLPAAVTNELAEASMAKLGQWSVPTHLRYELCLTVDAADVSVADEYLFLFPEQGDRPTARLFPQGAPTAGGLSLEHQDWRPVILRGTDGPTRFVPESTTQATDIPPLRVPTGQLALGAVPADPTLFPAALWFTQLLRDGVVFFDPDWDVLRHPAMPGSGERLAPSGQNIPWLALDLQSADPERFRAWVDHVRTALPQITGVTAVKREEDGFGYFAVDYAGGHRVTSSGLSDGTLRILALTLPPFLEEKAVPRLLVTEEPENGIHPRAIETVMQSLTSLYDSQVWVSTHSPIVLAHTDLADVLAARINEDGSVSVVPGDEHPRLRDWQGSIDIGSLFAAGVLS